jgi:ATP-dependent Clp protease ATP-binding subunit ClpC
MFLGVQVVARWTGMQIERLSQSETQRLRVLPEELRQVIVGQDDAVSSVARAVQRARVGMRDPRRPTAALLFAGPTGVGKTSLAKELAEKLFCSEVRRLARAVLSSEA